MMKKLRKLLIPLLLAAALLAGCGTAAAPAGQIEATASAAEASVPAETAEETGITVTDLAGITHTFPKPLEHVVVQWSCAGGPFMTMSALLGEQIADVVVGIDNTPSEYRADMWAQYV